MKPIKTLLSILTGILFLVQLPNPSSAQELAFGNILEVNPGVDLQKAIDGLNPGDQLVLHEGIYEGNLKVRASGLRDFPIIIRGYGNGEKRPVLHYNGDQSELLNIAGNSLVFDYLEFQSEKTYGVRIGNKSSQLGGPAAATENITIQNCIFKQCGGGDISANFYNVRYENIRIINNFFDGSLRTPVYIGSHPGDAHISNFLFRGNVIDGSQNDGPETTVGYGIELKLNVVNSVVEDNFITGTKGPGIMVYGADNTDISNANIVRNNMVLHTGRVIDNEPGQLSSSGIVVGGGPSIIDNNVVINCGVGIDVINYANRNLADNIYVARNTLIASQKSGITYYEGSKAISKNNKVFSGEIGSASPDSLSSKGNSYIKTDIRLNELIKKVSISLPDFYNLPSIRRLFSSGPLTLQESQSLLEAILKNSTEVRIPR